MLAPQIPSPQTSAPYMPAPPIPASARDQWPEPSESPVLLKSRLGGCILEGMEHPFGVRYLESSQPSLEQQAEQLPRSPLGGIVGQKRKAYEQQVIVLDEESLGTEDSKKSKRPRINTKHLVPPIPSMKTRHVAD